MYINFSKGSWEEAPVDTCYSFRFTETPAFTQEEDHIRTAVNPNHREGFDNISLLTRDTFTTGVTVTLRCSFEDWGCPEIILVPETVNCPDGAVRYGACFEVIPYKQGINVWRHFYENEKCFWHLRLGLKYPVAEHTIHTLTVKAAEKRLIINLDGLETTLRTEDLPETFHVGLTGCEGIVHFYDLKIEP